MYLDARVSEILIRVCSLECRLNLPFYFFLIVVLICYCRPQTRALDCLMICWLPLYCIVLLVTWDDMDRLTYFSRIRTGLLTIFQWSFCACFRPFCSWPIINTHINWTNCALIFKKSRSSLVLGARRITWSKVQYENLQLFSVTVQIWAPGFCASLFSLRIHIFGPT